MTVALVLGSGTTLADDVARAGSFDGVVACNDAGWWWKGELDAWVSYHPEELQRRIDKRASLGLSPAKRVVSFWDKLSQEYPFEWVDWWHKDFPANGSSGLFAVKYALIDLGFDEVKLCGIPLTATDHFYAEDTQFVSARSWRASWANVAPEMRARMTSMSGWTKALLEGQATMTRLTNKTTYSIKLPSQHILKPGEPVILNDDIMNYADNRMELQTLINGGQILAEYDYVVPRPQMKAKKDVD